MGSRRKRDARERITEGAGPIRNPQHHPHTRNAKGPVVAMLAEVASGAVAMDA